MLQFFFVTHHSCAQLHHIIKGRLDVEAHEPGGMHVLLLDEADTLIGTHDNIKYAQ